MKINLWGGLFVGAPGQLPTLPSPKSGPALKSSFRIHFRGRFTRMWYSFQWKWTPPPPPPGLRITTKYSIKVLNEMAFYFYNVNIPGADPGFLNRGGAKDFVHASHIPARSSKPGGGGGACLIGACTSFS